MKYILSGCFLFVFVSVYAQTNKKATVAAARTVPFDNDWLFAKDNVQNAEQVNYNDANWRKIDLPHDWSIEDLPNQLPGSTIGPFHKGSIGGFQTGFTVGGTGWYRKKFVTGKAEQHKLVSIVFDGVYMNSDVWLNGHHLGNHLYGYTPFYYDLTPYLKPAGQQNVLAVSVRNEGKNSRWYSGSGIYRHVWLSVTDPVHIVPWGVYITTPQVSTQNATVQVKITTRHKQSSGRNSRLITTLFSPEGKIVGKTEHNLALDGDTSETQQGNILLTNPALWSVETPQLYKAITEIKESNRVIDRVETPFGIRSLSFSPQKGFLLNGRRVILKGGCMHHDNGPLGAATIDRAEERKIEILKKNGFNAIRTSHNPPSKQLLDACDRLGMLVLDEAFDMWTRQKNDDDYHLYFKEWWNQDLTSMILRDRNHPAVILWSIGNEIPERADSTGLAIRKMLKQRVQQLDPSRLVTEAICRTPQWEKRTPAVFEDLDVSGYNYVSNKYETDHDSFPNRVMVGTETYPDKAYENYNLAEKHPYVIGDFVWTAFDYMGEAAVGNNKYNSTKDYKHNLGWPWFNAYCGNIDLIGNKKTSSWYRDVVWRNRPIAMAVHAPIPDGMVENITSFGWPDETLSWTWPGAEGKSLQVRVFSRAPVVRLLLNGKIIGEQEIKQGDIIAVFTVPYQPGTLKAVNVENGKETDALVFKTTGTPKRIRLIADRTAIHAGRNDLSYVMVEVTDDKGQVVPNTEIPVHFSINGVGEIAGVGNGSPTELASFRRTERNTWKGKCLAIVRPTGKSGTITLKATSDGLTPSQIVITTY